MAMKQVDIPSRDISVATRLAGLRHRIKVEISLEQILKDGAEQGNATALNAHTRQPSALVFYVPLDGLAVDSIDEEEDIKTQMRPRQR